MTETMEQYMSKTHGNYGSGVARHKIDDKTHFELKRQFLKELHENTFSGSKHEDANEHIEKVLEIVDLFHIPEILDSKGVIPTKTAANAKVAIQEMAEYSQKWHNGTPLKTRSTKTSDGLAAIQAQLNSLRREIKKVNEKVYAAQFGTPYQLGGQYNVAGPGFYQRNNGNSSYPDRRQTLEESLAKFIRNQGALIKTLEIQIGQMSKVLQERGFRRPYAKEARKVKILETYDNTLPQKEKDPWSFTLPCFIHNVCFNKALVDLGASVSVMPFSTYTNLGLDVFKRKITLKIGEEKLAFKSIKPATSIIRRVYVLKEGTGLDSKIEFIGEAINESFDPHYGNYIKLNDLDMTREPRMDQGENFEPTLDFVNEPTYKNCYKMKFSCMMRYKHVIADFLHTLSINMMTKRFYNSIIKDKGDHEGNNLAGTLIDIPIFVGNFSIISGFSIIDDMDITSGVVLSMPFCKKFVSCQKIMERFAHEDECERMDDE
ncbi:hypothetical protein Tco_1261280 [Tanacetum coccineum]